MKNFCIFLTVLFIIVGCEDKNSEYKDDLKITKMEYRGHQYLRMQCQNSSTVEFSIVHDPDCPLCKK